MMQQRVFQSILFVWFICACALLSLQMAHTQQSSLTASENLFAVHHFRNVESRKETIIVRNAGEPGGFEVENKGKDTKLSWRVLIERKDKSGKWQRLYNSQASLDIILTSDCNSLLPNKSINAKNETKYQPTCRKFVEGEILKVKPWTGLHCNAQCFPRGCISDGSLAPGTFRFVVQNCDRSKNYYGEEFELSQVDPKNYPIR